MFNKKIKIESIIENVSVLDNVFDHTGRIDNKRVCLGEIYKYLNENINDVRSNIKNKNYEKVLADLLLIQKRAFMSINRMHKYIVNKKITTANKANKKISNDDSTNKKIFNISANKKIIINSANNKRTNNNSANEKTTNNNSTNKQITNANKKK